jgi:hypothetical protein
MLLKWEWGEKEGECKEQDEERKPFSYAFSWNMFSWTKSVRET